ncbi:type II toxin-antitoxin system VapC family toxin [Thermus thermophilus]|uniref:Ribonuclease VapC n=1 Tax=Thermus scotoductus TaxID=37636 RepID=A0A430R729_THESC|nr:MULTISPECIES: type II toxin-antitoxin system VapC family toxin [Thermus]NHK39532.1 type II toxin-antitoxin system VapC family toxin [Thermus thermophilus]RTH03157.1 PIN domain-containing protein [Thermus scotoductus]
MDTNVVSEAVKRRPHPKVVAFLRHLKVGEAYLSALTLGELVQGVARAPEARRAILSRWLSGLKASFSGRILPLDAEVMELWGELTGNAMREGKPLSPLDAMLAATALRHGLILATRNTEDFRHVPVPLVNPWEG